jgi:thioredoxin reductase (NADPH)
VRGLFGENVVEGANWVKQIANGEEENAQSASDGLFLAIGHHPNSEIFADWLERDENGYLLTEKGNPKTMSPGIFAAGDVADPHYRQAITAAASGCKAGIEAERYLSMKF